MRGVEPDLLRPRGQVALIEQALERHAHEVAVGEVEVAVGEGELGGLEQGLHPVDGRAEPRHVEMLEQAQDLQHRDPAGAGRPHAADLDRAVRAADRLAQHRPVAGEILAR